MDQLKMDALRFSDLLSKYTHISKSKIDDYLRDNPVNNIFEHTASLDITSAQKNKLEELRELRNLYNTMKLADNQRYIIDCPQKAGEYFKAFFQDMKEREYFACAFLNSKNKIITTKILFQGSVSEAAVYPREVVKDALIHDTSAVCFSHNHPSGSNSPSSADKNVTQKLGDAFKTVNIKVIDHIIVAGGQHYSFLENGELSVSDSSIPYFINSNNKEYDAVMDVEEKYSVITRTELINKIVATKESVEGTIGYNNMSVDYEGSGGAVLKGSLTYQEDAGFLFTHHDNDFRDKYKGFKNPEEAADYVQNELKPVRVLSFKDEREQIKTADHVMQIDENSQAFTGIGIGKLANGKYDIEIPLNSDEEINKCAELFEFAGNYQNGVRPMGWVIDGQWVDGGNLTAKGLAESLLKVTMQDKQIVFNNGNSILKDMQIQYDGYKQELQQLKRDYVHIDQEASRLKNAEASLQNYEQYKSYLDNHKGIFSRIARLVNKDSKVLYKNALNMTFNERSLLNTWGVWSRADLAKQKEFLSGMIDSKPQMQHSIQNLSGKMNILSSIMQQIAKSNFKEITPDLVQHKATTHAVKALDLELEMEM